jgi:hypothetical protein
MLQTLDSEIRECYRHAAEWRRSADQSRDLQTKQDLLDNAQGGLSLARSYEFAQQLSNFSKPSRNPMRAKSIDGVLPGRAVLGCS